MSLLEHVRIGRRYLRSIRIDTDLTDPKALDYVIGQIDDGAMVLECGEDAAIMGREHTKRKMPV